MKVVQQQKLTFSWTDLERGTSRTFCRFSTRLSRRFKTVFLELVPSPLTNSNRLILPILQKTHPLYMWRIMNHRTNKTISNYFLFFFKWLITVLLKQLPISLTFWCDMKVWCRWLCSCDAKSETAIQAGTNHTIYLTINVTTKLNQ